MKTSTFALTVVVYLGALLGPGSKAAAAPVGVTGEYRIVEASRPDGKGGYQGKVTIASPGPASYQVQWALESGEPYHGPAILQNGVLGVGYGEGLTGLAVYEIQGRTLKAKWLLPAAPQQVGEYELTGPANLSGYFKFTNGVAGGVTIKPNGKVYDLLWNLPSGKVGGVAVKVGDVLVAVSGRPGSDYGVAAYRPVGNRVEGIWAVPGQKNLGTEVLVSTSAPPATTTPTAETAAGTSGGGSAAPGSPTGFSATGTDVRFAGETYHLEDGASAPGQPTSELREYLRPGEKFETYAKMVALRVQNPSGADPLTFTRVVLDHVKKDNPDAETHEIEHTDDSATMEFWLRAGSDVEYNFWHYFRVPQGLASVQFVLRNKPPFDTKEKFKAERTAHFDAWVQDAKALASQVPAALGKTTKPAAGGGVSAKPPEQAPATAAKATGSPDENLAAKIGADLQVAGGIAQNFLEFLKANKLPEATALIADEGFTRMKTTRKDFLAKLQQSQATDGRLVSFTPDKDKLDFGPEAGGIYFVLVADAKCEKAAARDTLRFLRGRDGKVRMVGYERAGK